jgi:hypothetical protein
MHAAARSPERGAYYGRGNPGRGYYGRGYNGRGYFARGYYGWPYRPYGPAFAGFGYYNDWYLAAPFIGLAAWELADYEYLNEQQIRAQENALAMATSAPLNEAITWNDSGRSGSVTPLRDGRTPDGKVCREFQQEVNVDGKSQQAYGTACQEADGSWQIVDNDGEQ